MFEKVEGAVEIGDEGMEAKASLTRSLEPKAEPTGVTIPVEAVISLDVVWPGGGSWQLDGPHA